jgi:hypothetical protein
MSATALRRSLPRALRPLLPDVREAATGPACRGQGGGRLLRPTMLLKTDFGASIEILEFGRRRGDGPVHPSAEMSGPRCPIPARPRGWDAPLSGQDGGLPSVRCGYCQISRIWDHWVGHGLARRMNISRTVKYSMFARPRLSRFSPLILMFGPTRGAVPRCLRSEAISLAALQRLGQAPEEPEPLPHSLPPLHDRLRFV